MGVLCNWSKGFGENSLLFVWWSGLDLIVYGFMHNEKYFCETIAVKPVHVGDASLQPKCDVVDMSPLLFLCPLNQP